MIYVYICYNQDNILYRINLGNIFSEIKAILNIFILNCSKIMVWNRLRYILI